jgi:hypothetical protein
MGGAIKTITNMVLISIHPFAFRKIFFVIAALLCFSAVCFADPVFVAQRYTNPTPSEFHDLKRVDLPSRAQEWLPNGEGVPGEAFPAAPDLKPLVIGEGVFYS